MATWPRLIICLWSHTGWGIPQDLSLPTGTPLATQAPFLPERLILLRTPTQARLGKPIGSGLSQLPTGSPVTEEPLCELGWEGLHHQTAWPS